MTTASPYCPGCFQPKQGAAKCPQCGYDESVERKVTLLPHWARLRGDKYVVGRVLGEGGFAITYLAMDQTLRRLVAVKELFPQGVASRSRDGVSVVTGAGGRDEGEMFRYALGRFLDEARVVAGFNHPNLVRVQEFFEENGTGYMVMDYYNGAPLDALLKERFAKRPMPEASALGLMRPVLEGLAVVHGKGWLHRDIKPANIYLADWRQPVLLDFGAARMALGEASRSLTTIMTPGYAPPEQYTSRGSKQGPWTDIYACAAVLYRMLTGQTPPAAPDRQLGEDELRPLAELRRDIRPSVAAAVDRGLRLTIEERPRDLAEFLRLLDEQGSAIRTPPQPLPPQQQPQQQPGTPPFAPQKPSGNRKTLTLALGGLAVVALLAFGSTLAFRSEPPAPVFTLPTGQKSWTNSIGMEFVLIPSGTFLMGCRSGTDACRDNERPQHRVTISDEFYLGKCEVTQAQWEAVMENNPSKFKGANRPVEMVSWEDAQVFIQKLNAKEGTVRYRLPTEAEWEYAARAGSATFYSYGDDEGRLGEYAWYFINSGDETHPVGQKKANSWGLHDMYGNVQELVQDWYGSYASETAVDPVGPSAGTSRVCRGGGYLHYAVVSRSYRRSECGGGYEHTGFRLALSPGH